MANSIYICSCAAFLAIFSLSLLGLLRFSKHTLLPGIPIAGRKSRLEPLWITRYRFVRGGWEITGESWSKFRDSIFAIVRPDSNVTVLPLKYIEELQNLPETKLHPMEALSHDMEGEYTGLKILAGSHLNFHTIRNKLSPKLGSMIPILQEELEYAMESEIPDCKAANNLYFGDGESGGRSGRNDTDDEWVSIDLNLIMNLIISRITARLWVGLPLCRDKKWHATNLETTEQIFATAMALRCLPAFLHPLVARLLPSRRQLHHSRERVYSYLIPLIRERKKRQEEGTIHKKPEDILQWMIDGADESESSAENLANIYVYAVIGSLFTVSGSLVSCLYDLIAMPEYIEPLREELVHALKEDGGQWKKDTPSKLFKMDSFMKESLRTNSTSPISFKRIVKEPITLSDGLCLPRDTYVCVVNSSAFGFEGAEKDSLESTTFDGFRYSKKRTDPGFMTRFQFTSTDMNHVTFGHGRYACPGRFTASLEIKMVLAHVLLNYDLKFPEGKARPEATQLLELSFQKPGAQTLIRRRRNRKDS